MLAVVRSSTLVGVDGHEVHVEVHVGNGLPSFNIVGLPDASCRESRDRVRAAILTSGFKWPDKRITVNLAPTHLKKVGAALDLAVAVGVLCASDQIEAQTLSELGFLGELGLDGSLRPVNGALPLVHALGDARPVVPTKNFAEASLIRADSLVGDSLGEVVGALNGNAWPEPQSVDPVPPRTERVLDLVEVGGHSVAKRALEVAAAGGHHLLMNGPPGAGKTMLAERLPSLMPDLDDKSAFDVSRIHSAAGLFDRDELIRRPPFRSPHHSSSMVALIGGGSSALRPGEISLASGGVLFLDEMGEFPASHLDALRQPMETGVIHIARAAASAVLPAGFILVAATNPCPCGIGRWGECRCSAAALARYERRLSGPLLDRFDIRLAIDPPDHHSVLGSGPLGVSSAEVRERVHMARETARQRGVGTNRQLVGTDIDRFAPLDRNARRFLRTRLESGALSMRGAQRLRLMALTIKDLEGESGELAEADLLEAMMLRGETCEIRAAS